MMQSATTMAASLTPTMMVESPTPPLPPSSDSMDAIEAAEQAERMEYIRQLVQQRDHLSGLNGCELALKLVEQGRF